MGRRRRVCSALIRLGAPTGSGAIPRCSSGMAADKAAQSREQTGRASVRLFWLTLPWNVPVKTLRTVVLEALPVANGRRLRAGTRRDLSFFNFGLNFHFRPLLLHIIIVYLSRCLSFSSIVPDVFFFNLWSSDSAPGGSGQRLFRQPNSVQKICVFLTRALQPENDQFSPILLIRSIIYQYLCYGRLGSRSEVRYFAYKIRELTSNQTGLYVQKYPVVLSIPGIFFFLLPQVILWRYGVFFMTILS